MLGIQRLGPLAHVTGFTEESLQNLASSAAACVQEWTIWPPDKKPRPVISVEGDLRRFQNAFYRQYLKPKLKPSEFSFGGIAGRHIVDNAKQHLGSRYVYKTDISGFFPSISSWRVSRLFQNDLRCSPDATDVLTRLCTYDDHLALGLVTSPILADQILKSIDQRIANLCRKFKLVYSRFVDDVTVSGFYPIKESAVPDKIADILESCGFEEKSDKRQGGRLNGKQTITGLRAYGEKIDISLEYLSELERRLVDHAKLGRNERFDGPFFLKQQLLGQINHVIWINPNRRRRLTTLFCRIKWESTLNEAKKRRLVVCKTIMKQRERAV